MLDEKLMHIRNISNMMKRHKRILIYALPGEGKSTILRELKTKYPEWTFYVFGREVKYKEPFIYELPDAFLPEEYENALPEFDVIYCLQYSREYKERITGVSFGDVYRPMHDYLKEAKYQRAKNINIAGKKFKNLSELKKELEGVI